MDSATLVVLVLSLCATLLIICIWITAVYKFCYSTSRGGGLPNANITNKFPEDVSRGLDDFNEAQKSLESIKHSLQQSLHNDNVKSKSVSNIIILTSSKRFLSLVLTYFK